MDMVPAAGGKRGKGMAIDGRRLWAVLYGAYDTDTLGALEGMNDTVRKFFGLSYAVVFRISAYACVISLVLLGLSFVTGPVKDMGANKAWAVRIVLTVILICGLTGLIQTAIDVSI